MNSLAASPKTYDLIIIGAGHNGLVAATFLARKGLAVLIVEEKNVIGGATRTERPFPKAPGLGHSTGAYLLGVMPPEILTRLGAKVEVIRRDPHYFLPTHDGRYLLFGKNKAEMKDQFLKFFSHRDWRANEAMNEEIGKIREDLAPSWLEEPLSLEATAERYIRPELRNVFMNLVNEPAEKYIRRFEFESELLVAMYAVTDGFSGLTGSFGSQGTGMNFLVHNMCRLPGSDGTFMIAKGGMGAISGEFLRLAKEAGAELVTGARVEKIEVSGGITQGIVLQTGERIAAKTVLCNCDPFRMQSLVGRDHFPSEYNQKLDGLVRKGTTMKVNLALSRLPQFKCLPENKGQHDATIHLLPTQEKDIMGHIRRGFESVMEGKLAEFPTIEWYIHTQADPSLQDAHGNHSSAFFVQWVPYEIKGSSWEKEEARYVDHLMDIAESFCPGFKSSVVDTFTLTPKKIEEYIGITHGHIHHVDNTIGFDRRVPYAQPIEGLYSCSAGTHPAGSVIGSAGHNSANRILKDLGIH